MKMILKKMLRKILPERLFDLVAFVYIFRIFPNRKSPRYFNEKVFFRKHYDNNYLYRLCSDKSKVRAYVSKILGSKYLIPLALDTKSPDDVVKLEGLEGMVIKLNTGSGMNLIEPVIESEEQKEALSFTLKQWMECYSLEEYEPHYTGIDKRIIVEKSLCVNGRVPNDYKFHCFKQKNDSVKYVLQLVNGRFSSESRGYYVNNLEVCNHYFGQGRHVIPDADLPVIKEILQLNEVLAQHFNYVRIDWFVVSGKAYFGELTFTPGGGLSSEFGPELEMIMCDMWVN